MAWYFDEDDADWLSARSGGNGIIKFKFSFFFVRFDLLISKSDLGKIYFCNSGFIPFSLIPFSSVFFSSESLKPNNLIGFGIASACFSSESSEVFIGEKSNKFKGINFSPLSIESMLSFETLVEESSNEWLSESDLHKFSSSSIFEGISKSLWLK